ncbi:MAG TPA: hydantoinase/oxoprolinase family protein, partial [Burkholderiales bacterium]|nr:hydantoinase/oxoprolinase family protein [Burkholderiales bacterium]
RSAFAELERSGRDWLAGEEPAVAGVEALRSVDARYAGQAFDIEVELPGAEAVDAASVARRFHDTYDRLYHNAERSAPIDLINLRVRIVGRTRTPLPRELARAEGPPAERARRNIWYGGAWHAAPVFEREGLRAGHIVSGPAIIEQFDTTTVVAPGFEAAVDPLGILILTHEK